MMAIERVIDAIAWVAALIRSTCARPICTPLRDITLTARRSKTTMWRRGSSSSSNVHRAIAPGERRSGVQRVRRS
jgi:hypothetical protein